MTDEFDITPPSMTRKQFAIFTAKRAMSDLVYSMSFLEGNPITIEEVITLMDGISISGHRLTDVNQIQRLDRAWSELMRQVENDEFIVSKENAIRFNTIIATDETSHIGSFRDGMVRILGAKYIPPNYMKLHDIFDGMLADVNEREYALERAVSYFTQAARNQFFFDGNRRTAQIMMNGILLSNGEHVITIPAKDRVAYQSHLIQMYETNEHDNLRDFLSNRQLNKLMVAHEREQRERKAEERDRDNSKGIER